MQKQRSINSFRKSSHFTLGLETRCVAVPPCSSKYGHFWFQKIQMATAVIPNTMLHDAPTVINNWWYMLRLLWTWCRNLVPIRHWFYHSSSHLAYHTVLWRSSPFAFVYYRRSPYPSSSCFLPKKHRALNRCLANPIYSVLYEKENVSDDYFNRSQMPWGLFCSGASSEEPIQPQCALTETVHMETLRPRGTNVKPLKSLRHTCRSILNIVC